MCICWKGAVYIYIECHDAVWTENQKVISSDGSLGDGFGWSVAIHDYIVVTGSYQDDNMNGVDAGDFSH